MLKGLLRLVQLQLLVLKVKIVAKVKEGQEVSTKPYQPQANAPQAQGAAPQAAEQKKQADAPKAEQKATAQA
jgi:membrane fusion protein (multidrug efflux system)